jgi:hypothetical protein
MVERIAEAGKELQSKHELLLDPLVMSDSVRLAGGTIYRAPTRVAR